MHVSPSRVIVIVVILRHPKIAFAVEETQRYQHDSGGVIVAALQTECVAEGKSPD